MSWANHLLSAHRGGSFFLRSVEFGWPFQLQLLPEHYCELDRKAHQGLTLEMVPRSEHQPMETKGAKRKK